MQVLTVHNNQADLLTYSNLFNKNQICERLTASNMPCQKLDKITPISQQLTRENSKDNLSQDDVDYSYTDKAANFLDNDHKSQSKPQSDQEPIPSFPQRSNDEARMSYINKLVNMKILNLKPKKKSQNVFVFDWDDTLFCTSSVGNLPLTRMPVHMRPSMQNLDATASQLLLKASQSGDVFIITNSDKGWVEQSSRQALPRTYQVIVRRNVQIISARKDYGERYPNDMYRWKLEAFLSLKRQFEDDIMTNLVVLGDSELEIRAANALGSQFKQCLVKTVKFKGGPKIEELIKQQNIITSLFDDIFTSCKGMTVKLGK